MQKTLYSSSPSPTIIASPPPPSLPSTLATYAPPPPLLPARAGTGSTSRNTPAIIPLDYNYQTMSPSAASSSQTHAYHQKSISQTPSVVLDLNLDQDNGQYNSLFGDPVPPPQAVDYFNNAFETLRTTTSVELPSSEEDAFGEAVALGPGGRRLFSDVPYSSALSGGRKRNFDVLPNVIPRLQPPDIQILPNSSAGSSSEHADSPNFALLSPQDIHEKPSLYETSGGEDVSRMNESYTICDATGTRKYHEQEIKRGPSVLSDIKPQHNQVSVTRQCSNESYSSTEWFHPAAQRYPEFSRIPKLRPSSKNILGMKREQMPTSPLATMLQDSNGSSSGSGAEERLPCDASQVFGESIVSQDGMPPARPPAPSVDSMRALSTDLILSPREYLQRRDSSLQAQFSPPPTATTPPPTSQDLTNFDELEEGTTCSSLRRGVSPVIIKDSIATGGDYRVEQTRLHKKSSFTIISDRSAQSSRSHSPSPQRRLSPSKQIPPAQSTTTSSSTVKPMAKPRYHLQRKSLTSTKIKLPHLSAQTQLQLQMQQHTTDDSPRPSVQFNMSGRYSPSKVIPQKSILQQRDSLTSSQDTYTPSPTRRPSTTATSTLPQFGLSHDGQKFNSCETLPLITDPYRSAIPRFHRSSHDVRRESVTIPPGALPRPLKPNPNPTRKQRGLLRVLNHEESLSRIPLRSNWTSMDDLTVAQQRRPSIDSYRFGLRRRSSSTSPERRSSTVTASDRRSSNLSSMTTSDFSFRRPSTMPIVPPIQKQRRKSLYPIPSPSANRRQSAYAPTPGRTKVAKPTTLSPIIGTPNKDSSTPGQSPVHGISPNAMATSDTPSDLTSRRGSYSRIPVLNSRADTYMSTSHSASRTSSPLKEFTATLPLSGRTSRATSSRSPSRATGRSTSDPTANQQVPSRANSRAADSRTSSRASTRPISREAHSRATSRASTRTDSRMAQARDIANSRANSRLSVRSSQRSATSISPTLSQSGRKTTPNRRKSISLSPPGKHMPVTRRKSISPVGKQSGKVSARRGRSPKTTPQRNNSKSSRIPTRSKSGAKTSPVKSSSKSPNRTKTPSSAVAKKSPSPKGKTITGKSVTAASAKKTPTAARRLESSVKRTPSTKSKQQTPTSTKKPDSKAKRQATPQQRQQQQQKQQQQQQQSVHGQNATGRKTPVPATTGSAANQGGKLLARGSSQQSIKKVTGATAETPKKPSTATDKTSSGSEKREGIPPLAEQVGNAVLHAAEVVPAVTSEVATANTAGVVAGLKRQGSNMSTLVRMSSRLSLIGKKRTDSAQSRKVPTVPEIPHESTNGADVVPPSPLTKNTSAGQLLSGDAATGSLPAAAILEKSQKTLESIQKTVTEATDEIHKTINENLTDLKTLENDMGITSDSATSPTPSMATVVAKPGESASRTGTADGSTAKKTTTETARKSPAPPTQPIEAAVSVLNANAETSERNYESDANGATISREARAAAPATNMTTTDEGMPGSGAVDFKVDAKRRSPDGQGGSTSGSGGKTGSQEFLEQKDTDTDDDEVDGVPRKGYCRCCSKLCMPCRRARCSRCCTRKSGKHKDESDEQPVLSATSSATTATNLEIIDEKHSKASKTSCWQRLNCCKSCTRKKQKMLDEQSVVSSSSAKMETIHEVSPPSTMPMSATKGPVGTTKPNGQWNKCGLCLSKAFCCRSVNKIDPRTGDEEQVKQCCFCIPCRRRRGTAVGAAPQATAAWQDPERGITATDASVVEGSATEAVEAQMETLPKQGCCKRFWQKLLCCRKQEPRPTDARRQSIKAPPTTEDTRRKLHVDLVEYTSKMKGAIPVLPLYLAWFCAICNTLFPGLGTLLSGFFCICLGIPRFSQYDSARARIGSFIINIIVAVAQFFCVLFCFVGWGWSIWWGTIMLRCAKKMSKIKKVEKLEMEEEQREAEAAAAAAAAATAAKTVQHPHVEIETTKS